jgi:hypothetical protein
VRLANPKVVQERDRVGGEVDDAVLQDPLPLASKVMVRKWREKAGTYLNPTQRPKTRPPIMIRGGPSPCPTREPAVNPP